MYMHVHHKMAYKRATSSEVHVYMYVYTYIYVYIYIYTHINIMCLYTRLNLFYTHKI